MKRDPLTDYVLFHNDYPVVTISINEKYNIEKIRDIHNEERLPVALQRKQWGEVNFFENDFSQKGDDIYIGRNVRKGGKGGAEGVVTPNNVSSGMLPKKWIREEGILYLIKGSDLQNYQEPFNEHIVSRYLDALGVEHVSYDLMWYKDRPFSKCPNMLGENEELIHAYDVYTMEKKDNKVSFLDHYIANCGKLGLQQDMRKAMDDMIIIDYVTANTDRHWSNFGIIRDVETLRAKRIASLYDQGASFFAKIPSVDISEANRHLQAQSFSKRQSDNMRLVRNFDLLAKEEINLLPGLIRDVFIPKFVHEERINQIVFKTARRIGSAKRYAMV